MFMWGEFEEIILNIGSGPNRGGVCVCVCVWMTKLYCFSSSASKFFWLNLDPSCATLQNWAKEHTEKKRK